MVAMTVLDINPKEHLVFMKTTGTTSCSTVSRSDGQGGSVTFSVFSKYECREGTFNLLICSGGSEANPCDGTCTDTVFEEGDPHWNVLYLNPEESMTQASDTTCTSYIVSGNSKHDSSYYKVNQGSAEGLYAEMGKICARYGCPDKQGIWSNREDPGTLNPTQKGKMIIGKSFKSNFDTCCQSCKAAPTSCEDAIEMMAPGGCYSQCGFGMTDQALTEFADTYGCTSKSQLVKLDEAIAESKRDIQDVGGRAHTSAMVLAAALVALAIAA